MSEPNYPYLAPDSAIENLKAPPFSREAEQSVLGGLMLNNEAWIIIADLLTDTDFYLREHQILFQAIKNLSEKSEPCDPVTLAEWLQGHNKLDAIGGGPYLAMLASNIPSAANIAAYAKIVRERSILRQLMSVGQEIADSAFNTQGRTSSQLLDNAEKRVFEIAELGAKNTIGFIKIGDVLTDTIDRIDILSQQDGSITGMETGFADFDQQTSGMQRSDLVIIAGRPSMGKTAFAMNIAGHVAVQKHMPVAVFSMEMSNEQLAMRLISSIAEVNLQSVRTGQLNDDDWPKLTEAVSKLSEAPLFIDETPALSPTELRARARRLSREQGQLSLIVIDYLQLMQVPDNNESRANEVSEISRSLKSLAKELNVPVLALSQLNRSLEQRTDKRPKMSDLRESGSIEQDADLIVFIYRDEVYNEESPDKGTAEIIIAKQRNGPIGTSRLTFRGNITRFESFVSDDVYYGE
ncbi:replicative DNA helicase [Candidatus Halobeggiatoa sp. HSG11]|nr:replicative DNA helicase [Candidatus Halobeggiatoa sp. HSG11]